jgi:hypothetical protein
VLCDHLLRHQAQCTVLQDQRAVVEAVPVS